MDRHYIMKLLKLDIDWSTDWVELLSLLFVVLGFIISAALQSSLLNYITLFFAGFLAGRVYFQIYVKKPTLPFFLVLIGFVVGYMLGGFAISRIKALLLFGIAFCLSFYLHREKIIAIFKSENFLK